MTTAESLSANKLFQFLSHAPNCAGREYSRPYHVGDTCTCGLETALRSLLLKGQEMKLEPVHETYRREAVAFIEQHRKQIQNSPGVGKERQDYAIACLDDLASDIERHMVVHSSPTPSHTEAVPVGWLRADGRFERGTELVSKHPGDAVGAIPLFSIPQPPAIDAETIQAAALEIEGMYYRTGVEAILGDVRLERVRGILNKHITHQAGEK